MAVGSIAQREYLACGMGLEIVGSTIAASEVLFLIPQYADANYCRTFKCLIPVKEKQEKEFELSLF